MKSTLRLPLSLLRKPAAERRLLIEAMLYLVHAGLLVRFCEFNRLTRFFRRPARQPELRGADRDRVRYEVSRAIHIAADLLPVQLVCLPRAIAAQAMLRRYRIGSILYYGAANMPAAGLAAHAWVQDGENNVIGNLEAPAYHVLARYSADN